MAESSIRMIIIMSFLSRNICWYFFSILLQNRNILNFIGGRIPIPWTGLYVIGQRAGGPRGDNWMNLLPKKKRKKTTG